MNLLDHLVTEALNNQPEWAPLRAVVEKELLHQDIVRVLSDHHLLAGLVFIGGTALRRCYGGMRLSEDLDFTGGNDFSRESLSSMGETLTTSLHQKYGLQVVVSEPVKDTSNTHTWKVTVETRPQTRHMPRQRIHIDICAVPSYEKQPMMLMNPYGVDMGTNGSIVQVQSREEIYTDKLLAFALRPNRIKYRDVWDIIWMHQQGWAPHFELIPYKLRDRQLTATYFVERFSDRVSLLARDPSMEAEFRKEMQRFLPLQTAQKYLGQHHFWSFVVHWMHELERKLI